MRLEARFAVLGFIMLLAGLWLQFSPFVALIVGGALLLVAATKRVKA